MEQKKLKNILADHQLFIKSNGKKGKKAILSNSELVQVDLQDTDLQSANLNNVDLRSANLSGAILNNASLSNADLSGADLKGASLISADLTDADLSNADLTGSILRGAVLNSAQLNNTVLIKADLTNVRLSSADLISANLTGADLSHSDLNTANMTDAILKGTKLCNVELLDSVLHNSDLRESDISNGDLSNSDLSNADFNKAILRHANLSESDLSNANLRNADLSEADISGALLFETLLDNTKVHSLKIDERTIFGSTIISNVDLSTIESLNSVIHIAPSSIGLDTIVVSKGKIDRAFLLAAGCQRKIIEFFDSYIHNPINHLKCLISFSDEDEEFVKKVKADLEKNRIRCWAVPEELKIDNKIRELILNNIAGYDSLILVISEKSIKSEWIEHEVRKTMQLMTDNNSTLLFPLRLDNTLYVEDYNWIDEFRGIVEIGDFTNWRNPHEYEKSIEILLNELKAFGER